MGKMYCGHAGRRVVSHTKVCSQGWSYFQVLWYAANNWMQFFEQAFVSEFGDNNSICQKLGEASAFDGELSIS
jgi:hypothetical protein